MEVGRAEDQATGLIVRTAEKYSTSGCKHTKVRVLLKRHEALRHGTGTFESKVTRQEALNSQIFLKLL